MYCTNSYVSIVGAETWAARASRARKADARATGAGESAKREGEASLVHTSRIPRSIEGVTLEAEALEAIESE